MGNTRKKIQFPNSCVKFSKVSLVPLLSRRFATVRLQAIAFTKYTKRAYPGHCLVKKQRNAYVLCPVLYKTTTTQIGILLTHNRASFYPENPSLFSVCIRFPNYNIKITLYYTASRRILAHVTYGYITRFFFIEHYNENVLNF